MRYDRISLYMFLYVGNFLDWLTTGLSLWQGATEYNFFYNYLSLNLFTFFLFKMILIFLYIFAIEFMYRKFNKFIKNITVNVVILSTSFYWLALHNYFIYLNMR